MKLPVTTVSGDYVQGSFSLLDNVGDRARASLHFARLMGVKSFDGNLELARWYLRAALSEYRSIFDILGADLKDLNLASSWRKSQFRSDLESDPIVMVLRKVRDFAIHSQQIIGQEKTFRVMYAAESESNSSDLPAIVIEPLIRSELRAGRGKDELSQFDDEVLSVFNEHAATWPADMLIQIAVYRTSGYLASFLSSNRHNTG